jgi:peptide/nickel transport system substrate-binding protein
MTTRLLVVVSLIVTTGSFGPQPSRSQLVAVRAARVLDPASGRVTGSVMVGSSPAGITSGAGRVWVTNGADGTVTRIDPKGVHVDQTVAVGSSPAGIVFADGAIWVANALDGSVSRIDPRAGRVVQTIDVGQRPVAVTAGAGAVWVGDAEGHVVVPVDPREGVPRRSVRLAESPAGVAVGFGALWVTEPAARKLVRVDPRTGETLAEIGMGGGAGPVAAGAGAVWVVNTLDGTLSRIDPSRNAVASTVPVGAVPAAVAADGRGVWVADAGAARLLSVDPESGAVRRSYRVGAAPVAVTLVGGAPWIAAGAPTGRAHRGGTLRVEYTTIRRLDPAFPFEVHPAIWQATGDTLVGLAESSGSVQLVPDLATTVPLPTDNGRTYAFRLRPGPRYSNGRRVLASDFRRGLERLYTTHSSLAVAYQALRGTAACARAPADCDLSRGVLADDRAGTVVLRLSTPDPGLLYRLTLPAAEPVPPGTPRDHIATRPIPSTGPYRVGSFVPGRRLVLVRNERFHEWSRAAQPDGYADRIDIAFHDDPEDRVAAVLHGHADLAIEIANAKLAPLRTRYASQLRRHAQPNTSFLQFNVRRPPFDDVRARRALNLALDRAALARRLGGRGLSRPTCQVLPPHFPGHIPYCPWTQRSGDGRWHRPDLARARALVRATGTDGARTTFVMRRDDPEGNASARPVAAALHAIGYRPRVIRDDAQWARRTGDPRGDWSLGVGSWIADYPSPDQFLDYFLSCSQYRPGNPVSSVNSGGFCNARLDRLIARAEQLQLADPANAERVWARADRLAVDQAAWAPMVNTASIELVSRRAGHFTLDANSQPQIDQLWVR